MGLLMLNFAALVTLLTQTSLSAPIIEIQALKDLYVATDGANWRNNTNWDLILYSYNLQLISNLSNYTNICFPHNVPFGIECDSSKQHITSISFNNNSLNGTLPSTLSNLYYLKEFIFVFEDGLYGTIPESLYNLTQLETFEFVFVNINGTISNSISNWINIKTLKKLFLVGTKLTGTVPSSIWYIDSLIELDLEINFYNLTIFMSDEMCNLNNLEILSLSDSPGVQGSFPGDCICSNWTHLTNIFLGYWYYEQNVIFDIYGEIPGIKTQC